MKENEEEIKDEIDNASYDIEVYVDRLEKLLDDKKVNCLDLYNTFLDIQDTCVRCLELIEDLEREQNLEEE